MPDVQQNKLHYGLKNVYYSKVTEVTDGSGNVATSYSTPAPWIGAVSFSGDPQGSRTVTRADDSDYFVSNPNGGYSGTIEVYEVPDDLAEWCFGEARDTNGIAYETAKSGVTTRYIALLFQFAADQKAIRHVMFKVSLSRAPIGSETTPEGNTPNPQTISITYTATNRPDADELVRAKADPRTDATKYNAWFSAVQVPAVGTPLPTYTYTAVSPVGTENPSEEGWYVLQGDVYVPTSDEEVDENKTYYERTEVT